MAVLFGRSVLVALLLVQAVASLGRGEAICIPLDCCGDAVVAPHRHHHGPTAGRSLVAHRHGFGDSRPAVERVHHACGHHHHDPGHRRGGHDAESGERLPPHLCDDGTDGDCGGDAACGDHLHLDLADHDLPPRGGAGLDVGIAMASLPAAIPAPVLLLAVPPPAGVAAAQAWIRSDQRRVVDVASIVV